MMNGIGFRPLTGISLFLFMMKQQQIHLLKFSSPHGDFSFSMKDGAFFRPTESVFVPSRGFLFFYDAIVRENTITVGFRPLTGISLFLFS